MNGHGQKFFGLLCELKDITPIRKVNVFIVLSDYIKIEIKLLIIIGKKTKEFEKCYFI